MKNMLNFEKISHLYMQQKVDSFKELIQKCLEEQHLLKDGRVCVNYNKLPITLNSVYYFADYKDLYYIRDGYCFRITIGINVYDYPISRFLISKSNKKDGVYLYLNEEKKEVLVGSL